MTVHQHSIRSLPFVVSLGALGFVGCASSVVSAGGDTGVRIDVRDAAVVDVPNRDVPNPPRDVPTGCPPGESAAGRCDGSRVITCTPQGLSFMDCGPGTVCVPPGAGRGASCDMVMTMSAQLSGAITFARRPLSAIGLGAARQVPLTGAVVQLLEAVTQNVRVSTVTDAMGRYSFDNVIVAPTDNMQVRVLATRMDPTYQLTVRSLANNAYAVTTPGFTLQPMTSRDIAIDEASNAGAFAIFDTFRRGLDFVRANLPSAAPLLTVRWDRGRTPPGGTSYFVRRENAIYLLGGPVDIDEFDEPVIFHEFGHFVEQNYSRTSSPGGQHDGSPTDPRLAWGEGYGTWFGCVANGSPLYLDTNINGDLRLSRDLANLPLVRQNMGDPNAPITQPVGEYLVAGSLWALTAAGMDRTAQIAKQLAVSVRYFPRNPAPDRGFVGVDFVDFLDGYLCLNNGADRATIDQYVVMQRRFPYDYGMVVCR